MIRKPFFTVIVPTYNQARYLGAALDSLLDQTDPDWEAVVVNDGSTDSTPEVLQAYSEKDPRIRVSHQANGGVGSALNTGLKLAQGSWLCWLSSDDLFEKSKLELHRDAILQAPGCRFFFSHFRYLHESTGEITNPPLWHEVPVQEWQILGMLRGSYIHGNSICINREAWAEVGGFDEGLRHGQDYDMWLRLLARYPATFIPERTCITRWHAEQTTCGFPEAGFFDSAKAAIGFLNRHRFSELFPLVNLEDSQSALEALRRALAVAGTADSLFLYGLGPHPALLLRILEWAWSGCAAKISDQARRLVRRRASLCARKYAGTHFGLLWRAAFVAASLPQNKFVYEPVSAADVAESSCRELETLGDAKAGKLRRYLQAGGRQGLAAEALSPVAQVKEVLFVNQLGMSVGNSAVYGALRATLEVAKHLMRRGVRTAILAVAETGLRTCEGVLVLGAVNESSLLEALRLWGPADTVVGISRGDFLKKVQAKRVVIYHHNRQPVEGFALSAVLTGGLNRARVPIICVSRFSRESLIRSGISADLIHVVLNGLQLNRFSFHANSVRASHSLVFAGHIVGYKGVDIALRAYALLRIRFPDAVFDVYGGNLSCGGQTVGWGHIDHVFPLRWLDEKGFPNWNVIERDLPGFRYHGEVSQEQLVHVFRTRSLLVMPSRDPETFGLVSLEAQACGCIPVLPRHGGYPETLRDGVTGFLYEINSAEGLCEKITELWAENLPSDEQRAAAKEWVHSNFSWEKTGASFARILEAVPDRHARTHLFFYRLWLWQEMRYRITSKINGLTRRTRAFRNLLGLNKETFRRVTRVRPDDVPS